MPRKYSALWKQSRKSLYYKVLASCLFQLPLGVINSTMAMIVMPQESEKFAPHNSGVILGVLIMLAGITQVVAPLVGKVSDNHRSRYGRRRPFMLYGTLLCSFGVIGLIVGSRLVNGWIYGVALFFSQIGLNVIYAVTVGGLVPDYVEGHHRERAAASQRDVQLANVVEEGGGGIGMRKAMDDDGSTAATETGADPDLAEDRDPELAQDRATASGVIAIFGFMGNVMGMGMMMILGNDTSTVAMYPVYLVMVIVACCGTWTVCTEPNTMDLKPKGGKEAEFRDYLQAFTLDLKEDADFAWVWVGRVFFYLSMSCLTFFHFYVRDMCGVESESGRRYLVARTVMVAQIFGALTAYPAGKLSDYTGRKKPVYISCALMALTFALYIWLPVTNIDPRAGLLGPTVIYGLAVGGYLSVDYALALDCLPKSKGSSEALGLWGIAGFIGSYIGPVAFGTILEKVGTSSETNVTPTGEVKYSYPGYVALLSGGCVCCFFAGLFTKFVKRVK